MTAPAIRTVGVPREIKTAEHRVSMTPDGVREFERLGIDVFVETGAGEGASISDDDYRAAGADIVPTAAIGLVIEARLKMVSVVMRTPAALSRQPKASK